MATPATIIGQIQPTPVASGAVPQVAGSPSQMQQIVQPVPAAQGVPLPASVPPIKQEGLAEASAADGGAQGAGDCAKENGVDGEWMVQALLLVLSNNDNNRFIGRVS